ncbi:MAG: right-handed parallel beta-helix repeat-containing protein [Candidatus Electrothrix aestuarii]|uniref:Right-handed parallel beta-helix repeat-containing protein n=1 Tax=Candidatus Electrothrix aestuarii TaxID=3062594 RepID=A0AAU8M0E6_9BACT|nr:right-handed parallel beta-helix repeat-containing protein [Candidatus Electrothrix aestuarii]
MPSKKTKHLILFCTLFSLFLNTSCQSQHAEASSPQTPKPVTQEYFDQVVQHNLQVAHEKALSLMDLHFHDKGRKLLVPTQYKTIQSAINAATTGDSVIVKEGIYYEQLVMKEGVKLISDASNDGNTIVPVDQALLQLPRRTLRTVIDGSKSSPSHHGMFDFSEGIGPTSIIDGFTIQNMPKQNHHNAGHAHAINMRGASAVVMNCLIRKNGSTGIGNHVFFKDQKQPMPTRDFRWQNINTRSSAVLYHNIIKDNFGLGIGCNHFSTPWVLGNEIFGNDDSELTGSPSPGIGTKHGAAPNILGNIVHNNPGGGILTGRGEPQGRYQIDKPTAPLIAQNIVFSNGKNKPGIGNEAAGSAELPVRILNNLVIRERAVGIGLMNGGVSIVEDNRVDQTGSVGIAINSSTVLRLNRNQISKTGSPGIVLVFGSKVHEMKDNTMTNTRGPKLVVEESEIYSR